MFILCFYSSHPVFKTDEKFRGYDFVIDEANFKKNGADRTTTWGIQVYDTGRGQVLSNIIVT